MIPSGEVLHDFFQANVAGFIITDNNGLITAANKTLLGWIGATEETLLQKKFSDLLNIGGKIYYETHLSPLLKLQGHFEEVLLEIRQKDHQKMRVLVNACEYRNATGQLLSMHFTLVEASDRLQYEQNLQQQTKTAEHALIAERETFKLREELIAVLGHDLRNPLNAITIAGELLAETTLNAQDADLVAVVNRSSKRMAELIGYVMDFARTRMGLGMNISPVSTDMEVLLDHVISELQLSYPQARIRREFKLAAMVRCDPHRIAQLVSNLLANALTHGDADQPIVVKANSSSEQLNIAVVNQGKPIPDSLRETLFSPFTREAVRPSQNGLGLGLYIADQIAKAHKGTLQFTSDGAGTCFSFSMACS